jgi:hypothetical protein
MAQILGELSYNNKTLKPIGRPIDDLKALYKDKQVDYMTAADNYTNTQMVLNKIPTTGNAKDEEILSNAKTVYNDAFALANEDGDFENKIMDSKKLANDLANKHGLLKVQENATTKQAALASLKDRLDKGKITRQQYQNAARDSDRQYKGIEKDEVTGEYVGNYNPTQVQDYVNASAEVAKALEGFKANKLILKDSEGNSIIRDNQGTGYMSEGTLKSVSEAELIKAAKSYIQSSPAIQSQFQEDTYFELQNLLYDNEGNKRELTPNDIKNLVNNSNSIELMEKLGIKGVDDLNNLDTILKGKDLERVYNAIKEDQLVNDAMALGVAKESFEEYEKSYLKDWQLEESIKAANKKKSTSDAFSSTGALHSFYTQDNITTADIERTADIYNTSNEEIKILESNIADMNKKGAFTADITRERAKLDTAKRTNNIISQRMESIIKATPDIVKNIRGDWNPTTLKAYNSISDAGLNKLLFKSMNTPVNTEDVKNYVKLDRGHHYAVSSQTSLTKDDVASLIQQFPEYVSSVNKNTVFQGEKEFQQIDYKGLNNFIFNTLETEGQKGLDRLNLTQDTKHKIGGKYHKDFEKAKQRFANNINEGATKLKEKAEQAPINYTKEFKAFSIPDLPPAELRAHPIHQLNYMLGNLTGQNGQPALDSNYANQLTSALNNLDIKTHLEQAYEVSDKDGEILWSKGKLSSSIDAMPDVNTGVYSPVVVMQVPIVRDKKETIIQVPVNYNEPTYATRYKEALNAYQSNLLTKKQTSGLSDSENQILSRINVNLYNTSPNARDFDLLNLYNAKDKEVIPFTFWDNHNAEVQVFEQDSPTNMSYYLTEVENNVRKYYALDTQGKERLVTENELKNNKSLTPIGGNTPQDLKTLFSNIVFNSKLGNNKQQKFRVSLQDTVDITSIFGSDIKQGGNVIPRIDKAYEPKVLAMKVLFPGLIITDALRETNSETGAQNSYHKYGKALDFRINNDSRKLIALNPTEKKRLGIKSVSVHNNDHVHLELE